jgi:tungstate transport system substrate-binding protein
LPAIFLATLCLGTLSLTVGCGRSDPAGGPATSIRLSTTTSARDTGLLAVLLPEFRKDTGIEVLPVAVGTGEALKHGERGDADVVLVHARKAEDAFMAAGHGVERRDAWWNRFLVVGPVNEAVEKRYRERLAAAGSAAPSAAAYLRAVRDVGAMFVSRGDESGTHKRELELWGAGGGKLERWPAYRSTGQGMGQTLTIADEENAYTLVDEGTWLKTRKRMRLGVRLTGDPVLQNPYGIILPRADGPDGPRSASAKMFVEWVTGPRGRDLVRSFTVEGERPFFLPGETPPPGS